MATSFELQPKVVGGVLVASAAATQAVPTATSASTAQDPTESLDVWVVEERHTQQDMVRTRMNVTHVARTLGAPSAEVLRQTRRITPDAFALLGGDSVHQVLEDRSAELMGRQAQWPWMRHGTQAGREEAGTPAPVWWAGMLLVAVAAVVGAAWQTPAFGQTTFGTPAFGAPSSALPKTTSTPVFGAAPASTPSLFGAASSAAPAAFSFAAPQSTQATSLALAAPACSAAGGFSFSFGSQQQQPGLAVQPQQGLQVGVFAGGAAPGGELSDALRAVDSIASAYKPGHPRYRFQARLQRGGGRGGRGPQAEGARRGQGKRLASEDQPPLTGATVVTGPRADPAPECGGQPSLQGQAAAGELLRALAGGRPSASFGADVDELQWREALQRAGGPDNEDHLWPVLAQGFKDLLARKAAQDAAFKEQGERLEALQQTAALVASRQQALMKEQLENIRRRQVQLCEQLLRLLRQVDALEGRFAQAMGVRSPSPKDLIAQLSRQLAELEGELAPGRTGGSLHTKVDSLAASAQLQARRPMQQSQLGELEGAVGQVVRRDTRAVQVIVSSGGAGTGR
eukprot:scaffold16.g139.t1